MHVMDEEEWRAFASHGTRTGKLATTRADGRPHVVPIWFVLDGTDVVLTTGAASVKGRNLRRDGRACLCVDDQAPLYSFVMIEATATISEDADALREWATRIAVRYMGAERGAEFGARNAVEGEMLVRLTPTHVLAQADTAA